MRTNYANERMSMEMPLYLTKVKLSAAFFLKPKFSRVLNYAIGHQFLRPLLGWT